MLLTVIDLKQKNLDLENRRHATHRFFPLTALIGKHGLEEGSSRITLRGHREKKC